MEILISVIGAITAIVVSVVSALLANKNTNILQIRELKEQHYISYIEAVHNLCANSQDRKIVSEYTFHRDKLFIVGSETVVKAILEYENEGVGKDNDLHDKYLTNVIKAIRQDLKINDKNFPMVYFKK
jgi:predicted amino acid-binding ACT domain protein